MIYMLKWDAMNSLHKLHSPTRKMLFGMTDVNLVDRNCNECTDVIRVKSYIYKFMYKLQVTEHVTRYIRRTRHFCFNIFLEKKKRKWSVNDQLTSNFSLQFAVQFVRCFIPDAMNVNCWHIQNQLNWSALYWSFLYLRFKIKIFVYYRMYVKMYADNNLWNVSNIRWLLNNRTVAIKLFYKYVWIIWWHCFHFILWFCFFFNFFF